VLAEACPLEERGETPGGRPAHAHPSQRPAEVLEGRLGRPPRNACIVEGVLHLGIRADDRAPGIGVTLDLVDRLPDRAHDRLGHVIFLGHHVVGRATPAACDHSEGQYDGDRGE
jgi:hypothetical protein